jgi:hypothetical protein
MFGFRMLGYSGCRLYNEAEYKEAILAKLGNCSEFNTFLPFIHGCDTSQIYQRLKDVVVSLEGQSRLAPTPLEAALNVVAPSPATFGHVSATQGSGHQQGTQLCFNCCLLGPFHYAGDCLALLWTRLFLV